MREEPKRPDRPPTPQDISVFAGLFATATAMWIVGAAVLGAGIFVGMLIKEWWRH